MGKGTHMGTSIGGKALQHDTACYREPSLATGVLSPLPPGKEDGRSCKKVTIRMTIRKNDCRSNTPVRGAPVAMGGAHGEEWGWDALLACLLQVNLVSCDGRCPSASIYNHNINTYARFCKCCREVGLQRRSVQLFCATNATWVPYTVQEPTDCACQWS